MGNDKMKFDPEKPIKEFEANGKKVIFRYPKMDDTEDCMHLINSVLEENHFLMKINKVSIKEEEQWLEKQIINMQNDKMIRLHVEVDGKVLGGVDVDREEGEAQQHIGDIGIVLAKEIRNMGLGTKLINTVYELAKQKMGIEVMRIEYVKGNEAAKHVYEKLGFKEIGVLPKARKSKGKYNDEVLLYKEI